MVGDTGRSRDGPALASRRTPSETLVPVLVSILMLLVAVTINGAYAIRHWAPICLFVIVVIASAHRGRLSGAPLVAVAAAWSLAAWAFASATWGQSPESAIEGGSRLVLYAGLFTLPLVTLNERWAARRVGAVALGGLAVVVVGTVVVVLADGESAFLAGRLDAPIGYRNGTAALFVLAFWPLLCVAAVRGVPVPIRGAAFSIALLALGLAFLTQSRGALIGFAAGGLVALLIGPERIRRAWLAVVALGALALASGTLLAPYDAFTGGQDVTSAVIGEAAGALVLLAVAGLVAVVVLAVFDNGLRAEGPIAQDLRTFAAGGLGLLAVVAVVGGLVVIGNPVTFAGDKLAEFRTLEVSAPGDGTRLGSAGGPRYDIWRIALAEFREAPIAGVGEGSYRFRYYEERATDRNLTSPHSLPLALLAETGLVGTLLFALFLGAIGATFAVRWRGAPAGARRWASASAAAGIVLIGQSTVDWLWEIPGLAGLGVLALGLAVALLVLPEEAVSGDPPRSRLVRLAPVVGLMLVALAVVAVYLADFHTRDARAAGERSAQAQLAAARTAARLNPVAIAPKLLQAGALEELERVSEARTALDDARRLEPRNFVVYGLIGDLEVRAGRTEAARRAYRRALMLNPGDVGLRELAARAA